jgi:hypothetical protein
MQTRGAALRLIPQYDIQQYAMGMVCGPLRGPNCLHDLGAKIQCLDSVHLGWVGGEMRPIFAISCPIIRPFDRCWNR